jgi:hypothetical protein
MLVELLEGLPANQDSPGQLSCFGMVVISQIVSRVENISAPAAHSGLMAK